MKGRAKQIVSFLLLLPVFNSRNITSIGLVAIFFLVYLQSGGKITTMPRVQNNGTFGGTIVSPKGDFRLTGDVITDSPAGGAEVDRGQSRMSAGSNPAVAGDSAALAGSAGSSTATVAGGQPGSNSTNKRLSDIQARLDAMKRGAGK